MRKLGFFSTLTICALSVGTAFAHHSFAVYFDSDQIVAVKGVATNFLFKNPHGLLSLKVKNKDGVEEDWKAETNSPSILVRRGWTKDSIKAGDQITVEGWPARDGSRLLRIRKVTRANGEAIGSTLDPTAEQK